MLQDLRDQKNNWIIVVLFGAIIVVFIFMFGLPSMDSVKSQGSISDLATIGKHSVGNDVVRSMIYQKYNDNIFSSPQYASFAREITQGISVVYLLADEAQNAGLRVSDEELQEYLTNWEYGNEDIFRLGFLHKNKFSARSYDEALRRYNISARDYEDYKRSEFLALRYMTLMASSITVSDEALWQDYARDNATASLEVIRLTKDAVRATYKALSDEEITAFETAGAGDIKKYYDEHLGEYTTPAKAKMHQIVIQKDYQKLTNLGAKTQKTYQPAERFSIAKAQIVEKQLDFAQAYTDYDESEDKSLNGVSGLLSVNIMAKEIQEAMKDKKVGDVFTAELSDRYVIGKVLEQTEEIVTPLEEVKHSIAAKLMDENRVQSRLNEVSGNILAMVQQGKSMEEALNETLYANVLAEQPMAPVEGTDSDAAAENGDADPAAPELVAIPTELPIVPEFERVKVSVLSDETTGTNYIAGIGVSDDLARDIRSAAANTMLTKNYEIGQDIVLVRVTEKKEASRDTFNAQINSLREQKVSEKALKLIGTKEDLISLRGPYGLWVQQKLDDAKVSGRIKINEEFFNRENARRQKLQEEREANK